MHLDLDLVPDQPRRHRIAHLLDPDGAARADPAIHLVVVAEPRGRQQLHRRQLLAQAHRPPVIGPLQHAVQKGVVVGLDAEVAAPAQEQVLFKLALQMPVARLDIPILVGTPDPDRLGGHAVVLAHRDELRVEAAFAARPQPVRRRAGVVHPQLLRHPAQALHAFLQPVAQRQQGLRLTPRGPLPVGIRQHRVAQQVGIGLPFNRDPQLVGVGPVQL